MTGAATASPATSGVTAGSTASGTGQPQVSVRHVGKFFNKFQD